MFALVTPFLPHFTTCWHADETKAGTLSVQDLRMVHIGHNSGSGSGTTEGGGATTTTENSAAVNVNHHSDSSENIINHNGDTTTTTNSNNYFGESNGNNGIRRQKQRCRPVCAGLPGWTPTSEPIFTLPKGSTEWARAALQQAGKQFEEDTTTPLEVEEVDKKEGSGLEQKTGGLLKDRMPPEALPPQPVCEDD